MVGRLVAEPLLLDRLRAAREPVAWCELLAAEVVGGRAIVAAIFHGPRKKQPRSLCAGTSSRSSSAALALKIGLEVAIGRQRLQAVREWAVAKSAVLALLAFDDWHFHRARCAEIALLLRRRLDALPAAGGAAILRAAGSPAWWPAAVGLAAGLARRLCRCCSAEKTGLEPPYPPLRRGRGKGKK